MSDLNIRHSDGSSTGGLSLAALLSGSKKATIKAIAGRYGKKLPEKLTKQQMSEELIPVIEQNAATRLRQYSAGDLTLMLDCLRGRQPDVEAISASAPFADGMLFVTSGRDGVSAVVPRGIAGKAIMRCAAVCRGTGGGELCDAALACAALWGEFTPAMLADAANGAYGGNVTAGEAARFLEQSAPDGLSYDSDREICRREGASALTDKPAAGVRYLPTAGEIGAYALFGSDAADYYYRQTANFIYNNEGISYRDGWELMGRIARWCAAGGDAAGMIAAVTDSGMILSEESCNYLLELICELSNRSRKQYLGGRKTDEVEGAKKVFMPRVSFAPKAAKAEPVHSEKKIGRNDPCPCGSGKKYKKCCGRLK